MSARPLLVAGTGGGVGTTTVAALVIALLRSRGIRVAARDHSGGTLGQRITPDDPDAQEAGTAAASGEIQVTDAGRLEAAVADALEVPDFALCLVNGPGVAAAQAGRAAVDGLLERFGQQARRRILVVVSAAATMRRHDEQLARRILHPDVELPRSTVLGSTGPIRLDLADKTLTAVLDRLGGLLAEFVHASPAPPEDDWPTRITRIPKPVGAEPAEDAPAQTSAAPASTALPGSADPSEPARPTTAPTPESAPDPPHDTPALPAQGGPPSWRSRPIESLPTLPPRGGPPAPARLTVAPAPESPPDPPHDTPPDPPPPARGGPPVPERLTVAPTWGIAPGPDDPAEASDAAPARAARRAPDPGEWDEPPPTGQERARRGDGLG